MQMEDVVELSEQTQRSKRLKIASHVARLIIGLVFIFSGFVKVVDPWGTMIKVNEYLTIYRAEWFMPLSAPLSIWMSGAELMMGMMLTFRVRIRMVSIFALISLSFFTLLSFLSATVLPVDDCGCFGDAIRLRPWATFSKNVALWGLAVVLWYRYKPDKIFAFNRLEVFLAATFFLSTFSFGTYCFYHLPPLDFRPYKIGVNLPEAIKEASELSVPTTETTLIYRNIKSGKIREFSLDEEAWQDDTKWEWVDTKTEKVEVNDFKFLIAEFSLLDYRGTNITEQILSQDGDVVFLCVTATKYLTPRVLSRVERYISAAEANGARVMLLTPELIGVDFFAVGNHEVESYNIDPSTMKTMIRANVGVVELKDGVIVDKKSWRDLLK
ncbi:MAG: BT_3928 family protein [Rikenellaceae bacterium]